MKNLLFTILLSSLFAFTSCISEKQLFIDDLKSEIPLDEEGRMNINVTYEGSKIIFELEPIQVSQFSLLQVLFSLLLACIVLHLV